MIAAKGVDQMKKNGRITLAVLAAGVILSTLARIYVIVVHTDMNTGFLYHGEELLCNGLYYGIVLAAMIAAVFTARADDKRLGAARTAADISGTRAVVIGFLTMLAGLFAAYEGLSEIHAISPMPFLMVVDFLFAAILIVPAFVTLYKKSFTPGLGYSYSLVGVYCVCRGIYCFRNRMVILTVPEYLIECLSLIGMAVFFVLLSGYLSGNETKRTRMAVCFWGVGSASLVLSSALGTLIASVAAPEEIRRRIVFSSYAAESFRQSSMGKDAYKMVTVPWTNVFLGLLAAASLFVLFMKPKSGTAEPPAEESERSE